MDLPIGSIILWDNETIPEGWHVCDGTLGTPNLINMFVRGASSSADLLASGGVTTHTHTMPNTSTRATHRHSASGSLSGEGSGVVTATGGREAAPENHSHSFSGNTGYSNSHAHTVGASGSANNLPPYIKLYYIMRLE